MKYFTAVLSKFLLTFMILGLVLGLFSNLTVRDILLIAVILTSVAYLLVDVIILPRFGNAIAIYIDTILSITILYILNYYYPFGSIGAMAAITSAMLLDIVEMFFHKYIAFYVFD